MPALSGPLRSCGGAGHWVSSTQPDRARERFGLNTASSQVSVSLELSDEDANHLRNALNLDGSSDLGPFLQAVAQTASELFLAELLGETDYPTKSSARQARLLNLVRHGFGNVMPSPRVVASLFHITPQAAAMLIAATSARYARALEAAGAEAVRSALRNSLTVLDRGKNEDQRIYRFRCTNATVVKLIKDALSESEDPVHPLVKDPEATNLYRIHASAVQILCRKFSLNLEDLLHDSAKESGSRGKGRRSR